MVYQIFTLQWLFSADRKLNLINGMSIIVMGYCVYGKQGHFSKDDAKQQLLRILRSLPYGNSVFFSVRRIEDPIGLLPGRIILGINKRGVSLLIIIEVDYLFTGSKSFAI